MNACEFVCLPRHFVQFTLELFFVFIILTKYMEFIDSGKWMHGTRMCIIIYIVVQSKVWMTFKQSR